MAIIQAPGLALIRNSPLNLHYTLDLNMLNLSTISKSQKASSSAYAPTSEEMFIRNYLEEQGIKYKAEHKLNNLYGDEKSYRKVDFYLPKFKVYVEYFGMYNSTKAVRNEYDRKAKVYIKNSIPTIFLYPHELGFLDYVFHTKMLKLLRTEKFKNKYIMFKYKLSRYLANGKGYLLFLSLFSLYLALVFLFNNPGITEEANTWLFGGFLGAWGGLFYNFCQNLFGYFFKDY